MAKAKLTWHWICQECADVHHRARVYRLDHHRRTGTVCCFCQENEPMPGLEGQGRKLRTCRC